MTRELICGHCGERFEDAVVCPMHDCQPECSVCGEVFDDKIAESRHNCPERPVDDGVVDVEAVFRARRQRRRERVEEDAGRMEQRRLGVDD